MRPNAEKLDSKGKDANIFKVNCFMQALGPDGNEILKTVQEEMTGSTKDLYGEITKALQNYFEPKKNIFHQRRVFISRMQGYHESIFEFVDAVRNLAQHIEVTDKNDCNVWVLSVIINGLKDRKLAERLQLMEKLTLQAAVSFLISSETVKRQDKEIHKSEKE